MLAIWDIVFFQKVSDKLRERGLVLFSRAHMWGAILTGNAVLVLLWVSEFFSSRYCGLETKFCYGTFMFSANIWVLCVWVVFLVAIVVEFLTYRSAFRQGGALVFYLVMSKLPPIEHYALTQATYRKTRL